MNAYKTIQEILKADQADRAFLKQKNYDPAFLTAMTIRDYNRAEQIVDLLEKKTKITGKVMFEVAVVLHHSPSLKFSKLAESLRLGYLRSEKLLTIVKDDQKKLRLIVKPASLKKI